MNQTPKYKLNLVEPSDAFSHIPLNENMEKVEDALEAARNEARAAVSSAQTDAKAATDAVSSRVTALEARKIVWGTYTGNGSQSTRKISLGFTPSALILRSLSHGSVHVGLVTKGHPLDTGDLVIVDGGFTVNINSTSFNHEKLEYVYVAFV